MYTNNEGYKVVYIPKHLRTHKNGTIPKHRAMAEKALGKPLPKGVEIHHHGAKDDNTQLVICENRTYHRLLHKRTKALRACGHASWIKCEYCGEYDNTKNFIDSPLYDCHKTCLLKLYIP